MRPVHSNHMALLGFPCRCLAHSEGMSRRTAVRQYEHSPTLTRRLLFEECSYIAPMGRCRAHFRCVPLLRRDEPCYGRLLGSERSCLNGFYCWEPSRPIGNYTLPSTNSKQAQSALPLSHRGHFRLPTGFEPATTRLRGEVTRLFASVTITESPDSVWRPLFTCQGCWREPVALGSTAKLRRLLLPIEHWVHTDPQGFEP